MEPGDIAKGLIAVYVNQTEISLLDADDMVRCTFASVTGPEGVNYRCAVLMREDRAEAFAEGILQLIAERRKRACDGALREKPKSA